MTRSNWFRAMGSALLAVAVAAGPSQAAPLYWDANGTAPISGGAGTWNTSSLLWCDSGATTYQAWNNSNGDDAYFTSTGGDVALGTNISVHDITINSNNYRLTGGSSVLTLTGTSPSVSVATGITSWIYPKLDGTSGFNKTGGGYLYWAPNTTANALTGGVTVTSGTMTFLASVDGDDVNGNGMFTSQNDFTVKSGAMLAFAGGKKNMLGFNQQVTIEGGTLVVAGGSSVRLSKLAFTGSAGTVTQTVSQGVYYVGKGAAGEGSQLWTVDASASGSTAASPIYTVYDPLGGGGKNWTIDVADGAQDVDFVLSGTLYTPGNVTNDGLNLKKIGAGTMSLSAGNSRKGKTIIGGGILRISAENALGANPDVVEGVAQSALVADALTLAGGTLQTTTTMSIDDALRGVTLGAGGGTFLTNPDTILTIAATNVITGNGGLTKSGSGKLNLLADNTYQGGTTIAAGDIRVGYSTASGSLGSGNVTLAAGTKLGFCRTDDITVANQISGAGNVYQTIGGGALTLSGDNTFTGVMGLAKGTLRIGADAVGTAGNITSSALGCGELQFMADGVCLSSDGTTARDVLNDVGVQAGAITLGDAVNNGKLTFQSGVQLYKSTTMTVRSDVEFAGEIGNDAPGYGITKAGDAKLILSGVNTYTGDTTVDAGTLELAAGGSLAIIVADAGSNQLLGDGTLALNGTLAFDLHGVTGLGSWDIIGTDLLANTSYGETFGVTFTYVGGTVDAVESGDVWSYTDEANGVVVSYKESTGVLAINVVPEPSTIALLAIGLMGLLAYAWRRRK